MWIYLVDQKDLDRNTLEDVVIVALKEEKGEEYIEAHLNILGVFSGGYELYDAEHLNYLEMGEFLSKEFPKEYPVEPLVASYMFKFMLDNNYIQKKGD